MNPLVGGAARAWSIFIDEKWTLLYIRQARNRPDSLLSKLALESEANDEVQKPDVCRGGAMRCTGDVNYSADRSGAANLDSSSGGAKQGHGQAGHRLPAERNVDSCGRQHQLDFRQR